jgi:hypothetical protein
MRGRGNVGDFGVQEALDVLRDIAVFRTRLQKIEAPWGYTKSCRQLTQADEA